MFCRNRCRTRQGGCRRSAYGRGATGGSSFGALHAFSLNSAFLRLALNVLAHLDVDEAAAELVARLSHAPQSRKREGSSSDAKPKPKSERAAGGKLGRVTPREALDLFQPPAESPLHKFLYDDPDWGASWVNELRKRYGALLRRGLHDEQKNPFARAFPRPAAWSTERSTASLDQWFGALTDEVTHLGVEEFGGRNLAC